jgi:choline kinase
MKKIDTMVILSAGKGLRLNTHQKDKTNKTLVMINNKILIEQSIINIKNFLGIKKIYVIGGYKFNELKNKLIKLKLDINFIYNKNWKRGNATSLICACKNIKKPFFMQPGDHYFHKNFYKRIKNTKQNFFLACSKKLEFFHDFNDATKVLSHKKKLFEIGKNLKKFDCFDTGFFSINPKFLNFAYKCNSISEILNNSKKKINLIDANSTEWIDIDTKKDIKNFQKAIKKKIFIF